MALDRSESAPSGFQDLSGGHARQHFASTGSNETGVVQERRAHKTRAERGDSKIGARVFAARYQRGSDQVEFAGLIHGRFAIRRHPEHAADVENVRLVSIDYCREKFAHNLDRRQQVDRQRALTFLAGEQMHGPVANNACVIDQDIETSPPRAQHIDDRGNLHAIGQIAEAGDELHAMALGLACGRSEAGLVDIEYP